MAKHWSTFVGVSEKQAWALDRMAKEADKIDGMALLMEVTGFSRSKVGGMNRQKLNDAVTACFEKWGNGGVTR